LNSNYINYIGINETYIDASIANLDNDTRRMFEDDFDEIDGDLDGVITVGELSDYMMQIGHYNPHFENEFEQRNQMLIDLMDAKENGGNNDSFVNKKEFLSYLGNKSDIIYSSNTTELN